MLFKLNTVNMIMKYEQGDMTSDEMIEFYQHLVDTGTIRALQGHYQRNARQLVQEGLITLPQGESK